MALPVPNIINSIPIRLKSGIKIHHFIPFSAFRPKNQVVEAAFFFPPIIKTAIAELTTIIIAVVCRIFPIPTKGETIPPARKLTAPNTADAAPAFCRSESNAKAEKSAKQGPRKSDSKKEPFQSKRSAFHTTKSVR